MTGRAARIWGPITDAETTALACLATGHSYRTAAKVMGRSERSVKNYVAAFTRRHSLRGTVHAVAYAVARGWVTVPPTPTARPHAVPCRTIEHARTR